MGKSIVHFLFLICMLFSVSCAFGQAPYPVAQITSQFQFDGEVDPSEWSGVEALDVMMQQPVFGGEPTQKTVIYMGYDESYIYLAGALYDDEPEKIMATNKLRDGGDENSEWLGMVIDSYNDKQNALSFFTTPTSSRMDLSVQNDNQGRNPMNLSWNNFWDAKTSITDEGWFAELRIPFSSLQYQVVDGEVIMGITVWRYLSRTNERHMCPGINPVNGSSAGFRPSLAREYVFKNIKQKKPFYITPYALAGYNSINELSTDGRQYVGTTDFKKNVGLDMKYGLSNNFTLDLSVNTDFAQVEADDQQVNLTRFSLFFPEKRLFFQERSGIFDFGIGSRNNLFYSRRIGIDDDGNAIPILGGVRLTGRAGGLDVGVISMQTKSTDAFSSNNYSVFRLKKAVIDELSTVGLLITNQVNADGNHNTVYGLDGQLRLWGDNFLTLKFAQSITEDTPFTLFSSDPSMFWMSLSNRNQRGFTYGASLSRLGKDFQSRMGFLARRDYTRIGTRLQYFIYSPEESVIFRHGPSVRGFSFWENSTNKYNSNFYAASYNVTWKNGRTFGGGVRMRYDDVLTAFDLADAVTIPADDYLYFESFVETRTSNGFPYVIEAGAAVGSIYDGTLRSISIDPTYNVSSFLTLGFSYELNDIDFTERNQSFTSHLARLRAQLMFSTKFSISSFLQYNSLSKLYLGNIRLRYNPKEGNDLFIVYNTDVNADRSIYDARLPFSNQSSLLVKYSYTFTL